MFILRQYRCDNETLAEEGTLQRSCCLHAGKDYSADHLMHFTYVERRVFLLFGHSLLEKEPLLRLLLRLHGTQ